jgi:methylenetetrahydrofolate--tRNA-(uracil-5-)-methyltransferase
LKTIKTIKVIGGGLAGSETAWQLAESIRLDSLPYHVELYEMRPVVKTPAHHTDRLAELVCSNSLGSEYLSTARGVLINEMQEFNSLIIKSAIKAKVPAGQALAVDRDVFGYEVSSSIENHPNITLIREEFRANLKEYLDNGEYIVIATGPLTSEYFAKEIQGLLESVIETQRDADAKFLNFFDAASPILTAESIDMSIAYRGSRYDKHDEDSEGDYINCPFYSEEEFESFYQALINAERAPQKEFEKESFRYFQACMPIEAIADKGKQTLCFGPMKPKGLKDPRYPDRKAVAVVQLRQDNVVGSLYNIVGFQTNLKWGEQKRVFSMIPGLQDIDIVRYGVMHQNIFINSPIFLNADMSLKIPRNQNLWMNSNIYFAGQITGVEGYTESAASGIIAARSIIQSLRGRSSATDVAIQSAALDCHVSSTLAITLPKETMMGALANYISTCDPKRFQPINSNWGLINTEPDKLEKQYRKNKKLRYEFLANRALGLVRGI